MALHSLAYLWAIDSGQIWRLIVFNYAQSNYDTPLLP